MDAEVGSCLQGTAALGKEELAARGVAVEGKGIVAGVGEVAAPELKGDVVGKIEAKVSAWGGVEGLAVGLRLVPVDLPLGGEIGAQNESVECLLAEGESVVGTKGQRVGWHERNGIPLVGDLLAVDGVVEPLEGSMCVAVGEMVGETVFAGKAMQGELESAAVALGSVDGQTAIAVIVGKA